LDEIDPQLLGDLKEKDLGLGNQDFCPWRECQTNRTTKIREAIPDELGSPHCTEGQCVVVHNNSNRIKIRLLI
jgi:hypothetical protein